ncbi:MAG TPA: M20/M25/M40 family metallo-hydrolase [Blastocatellia bacterium]|nr:M20/M25/M40 family metallo-hydrolase [Blastocatellia bacterium]
MRRLLLALLVLTALVATPVAPAQAQRSAGRVVSLVSNGNNGADDITAAHLKEYLYFIASDEMEGRDTPSRGLDLAAKFIAMNLALWGVKPAGENGTYFQPIRLRREQINASLTRAELNGRPLNLGESFIPMPRGGSASAPMVYAGNGWVVKAKNINPYSGIDIKDKVVVILGMGLPRGVFYNDLQNGKQGEDWIDPLTYAQKNGARAVIAIPQPKVASNWQQATAAAPKTSEWEVEKFQEEEGGQLTLPVITASPDTVNLLFEGEQVAGAEMLKRKAENNPGNSFALNPQKSMTINVVTSPETATTSNVIGVVEGSDATLKQEYVAIGSHYDHVGIGNPVNGDAIYNGADDDGSGTVAMLDMARAFASNQRPRRSILFVWHTAEEKGLWGAKYFNMFPTVPTDKIVAQLNIDMIGRSKRPGDSNPANKDLNGPHEIYIVGSKMMSTELGELSEQVNNSYLKLKFNYKYDDPRDPERLFYRSDHYYYALKGIPIIFYTDGPHEDYHKPSDTADKIDYQLMEKVTRTIYKTAWELAVRPNRPRVDKKLPPASAG